MSFIPNSFQTPNDYVDQLMHLLTPEEFKVLIYAARRIFGFQKRQDTISLSQFERGKRGHGGHQLDNGTGLSRPAILRALASLAEFSLLIEVAPNDLSRNEGATYALQLNSKQVNFDGLTERVQERSERGRSRTASAREKKISTPQENSPSETADPVSGTDHPPVSGTDHPPVSGTDHPPVSGTDRGQSVGLTALYRTEIQIENQKKHTHLRTRTRVAPIVPQPDEKRVCGVSVFSEEQRETYARNHPEIRNPGGWLVRSGDGRFDAAIQRWIGEQLRLTGEKRNSSGGPPALDTKLCPDCHGSGMYYPGDFNKGAAKCRHARLLEATA